MGALPAEAPRSCAVSSERTGMEGKAKAEQNSLTQAEEEDRSVQAYCADSCRQRMRPLRQALAVALGPHTIVINSISGAYLAF